MASGLLPGLILYKNDRLLGPAINERDREDSSGP